MKDGHNLTYNKQADGEIKYPYPVSIEGRDVRIGGLDLIHSGKKISKLWTAEPVTSVYQNEDGSYTISYALDAIGQIIKGTYKVKNNEVTEHYFEQSNALGAMFYTFLIVVVYALGAAIRGIVWFVRKKKQRNLRDTP